ncbi:tRNA (adenosine(37)-N6)-threonylcarbamoyltransferase complex transferase subunit TsaD [Candidatus Saccharibacteria bacterium]|nr:tRNA (adenosine(37)-N6)-threonylcarbamoyltransferase complex transferase subunit TsaD [Candidatus Saccharibacteria bacterium]
MKILGIETSCDETAASVVENGDTLLSNVVFSSMDLHVAYGGVVPEIAARSHIEAIIPVIKQALSDAKCTWDDIDGIAVTYGAGLGGSLLVGVLTARTLAITHHKPLYAINHVEGHVYANFLIKTSLPDYVLPAKQPKFPMLAVIVSGGHSQLALFQDHFDYTLLGQTRDDAIGEAFDKVAKILGLPYPGGPSVGKTAAEGDPFKYELPIAQLGPRTGVGIRQRIQHSDAVQGGAEERNESYRKVRRASTADANAAMRAVVESGKYDFSYSGLKTAVLRLAQHETGHDYTFPSTELSGALSDAQKADIAASFQRTAVKTIVDKAKLAYEEFAPASVVIAGGVAASPELRRQLSKALPLEIDYTDPKLCTDNGAMVATLGCFSAKYNRPTADPKTLDIAPNLSM